MSGCAKCQQYVDEAAAIVLKDGTTFHSTCFTCDICTLELPKKFASKAGRYYHIDCYTNAKMTAPQCARCTQLVMNTDVMVVANGDLRFHAACYLCDVCNQQLGDRMIEMDGSYIHEDCLQCSMCNQNMQGLNYTILDQANYVCDSCLQQYLAGGGETSFEPYGGQPQLQRAPSGAGLHQQQSAAYFPPAPVQNNTPMRAGTAPYPPSRGGPPSRR